MIFASSREVYGNAGASAQSEERADHHHAASPYAAGKIAIDGLLRAIELMNRGYLGGHAVNLGSGCGHSLGELACLIGNALGHGPRINLKPSRTGEVRHYVADIGRARSLLGFNPQTDLSDGVTRAVEWWASTTPA